MFIKQHRYPRGVAGVDASEYGELSHFRVLIAIDQHADDAAHSASTKRPRRTGLPVRIYIGAAHFDEQLRTIVMRAGLDPGARGGGTALVEEDKTALSRRVRTAP